MTHKLTPSKLNGDYLEINDYMCVSICLYICVYIYIIYIYTYFNMVINIYLMYDFLWYL